MPKHEQGATTTTSTGASGTTDRTDHDLRVRTGRGEETKPSWKTSELAIYLLAVLGVLLTSQLVGESGGSDGDVFTADKAWWFITLLTIGYLVSRGLAKAGSRTRDTDPRTD